MVDYLVQTTAMVMIGACYVPQIIKLYRTKEAESQSVAFWVMLSVGLLANVYIAYGSAQVGGGWSMFIIQLVNTVMSVWTLVLVTIYQKDLKEGKD